MASKEIEAAHSLHTQSGTASFAWGCFRNALHCLLGPGTLRQRLTRACTNFEHLDASLLPEQIRQEYGDFLCNMAGSRTPEDFAPEAVIKSLEAMDESEMRLAVAHLLHMHDYLQFHDRKAGAAISP